MLELKNISKNYGSYPALTAIDLKIHPGQIHGIVGVNGSGKSTLLNILSGQRIIRDTGGYRGTLVLDNAPASFADPGQAMAAGIGMVHQEFALIPGLTLSENICLSRENTYPWSERIFGRNLGCINPAANRVRAVKILKEMGMDLDPDILAGDLGVGAKQFVELAREFNRENLEFLLLDEPTAVLGGQDALKLTAIVRKIAARGIGVVYVSHRLGEVLDCCDRITILRKGRVVESLENNPSGSNRTEHPQLDKDKISALSLSMVGRMVNKTQRVRTQRAPTDSAKRPILRLSSFSVEKPGDGLDSLDLDVFSGEILGITSLSGHGRSALGPGIMGLYPVGGRVWFNQTPLVSFNPSQMMQKKIGMLPEDRSGQGLLLDHSLVENMTFSAIQAKAKFVKKSSLPFLGFPDTKQCLAYASFCQKHLNIDCRSVFQKAFELSGGNQQKVCIANALSMEPTLLFVNDPTRGIDVEAKESILALLIQARKTHNMTLVVSSGEIDELKQICDRIVVLYQGRMVDVLTPDHSDADYLLACSGVSNPDPGSRA